MSDASNIAKRHRFSDGYRTHISMRPVTAANWAAVVVMLACLAFWAWVIWESTQ